MKHSGEHCYLYIGWDGFIFALYGTIFGRYIDLQWDWTILTVKEDELDEKES